MGDSKRDQEQPTAAQAPVCSGAKMPTAEEIVAELDATIAARILKRYQDSATGQLSYEALRRDAYPVPLTEETNFRRIYPEMYEALMVINRFSPSGNWLVATAKKLHLRFSLSGNKSSLGSYGARHIRISSANSIALNVSIIAHEIFHGVQQSNGALNIPASLSFRSQAAHEHCVEAAAQTYAIRVAFEAKLNGYPAAFDYFDTEAQSPAEIRYAGLYHEFAHAYGSKVKQGATQEAALQEACDHTYQAYLDSQSMRDVYNSLVLSRYMRRVVDGPSQMSDNSFDTEQAYERSRIDKERMLISRPMCPQTDREIFGNNKLLRQAFEFAEHQNLVNYARGRDREKLSRALAQSKKLEADDNPYWERRNEFSLEKALDEYEARSHANKQPVRFFEVLNDVAGIGNDTQLSLNFFHVAKAREQDNRRMPLAGQLLLAAPKV